MEKILLFKCTVTRWDGLWFCYTGCKSQFTLSFFKPVEASKSVSVTGQGFLSEFYYTKEHFLSLIFLYHKSCLKVAAVSGSVLGSFCLINCHFNWKKMLLLDEWYALRFETVVLNKFMVRIKYHVWHYSLFYFSVM